MNYSHYERKQAIPEAVSMIESFRCLGYNPESAIADIIDNSIAADANKIWLNTVWDAENSVIAVTDNGFGMTDDELSNAMKPGCKGPSYEREEKDLGRFGLGMKTASFSQTRKFTVISKKKDSGLCFWTWDLDLVKETNDWAIIKYCPEGILFDKVKDKIMKNESGTAVIWWDLDRITLNTKKESTQDRSKFYGRISSIENHLATIFHRFIEDNKVRIYMGDHEIEPWNPYYASHDATQPRPDTDLMGGKIKVKGFVLPHRTRLTKQEQDVLSGIKGNWTEHQGFYVYRNKRLIIPGDWLNLFKRELHYDLCRIQVDIGSDLDNDWQIDIRKAFAKLPTAVSDKLKSVANDVRKTALEVYRHRGKVLSPRPISKEFYPVWKERIRESSRHYILNREHPIIKEGIINSCNKKDINSMLRLIEETIPVHLIQLRESENLQPIQYNFENRLEELLIMANQLYDILIGSGLSSERACEKIAVIEPFDSHEEIVNILRGRNV